jgi:hypothetical protein
VLLLPGSREAEAEKQRSREAEKQRKGRERVSIRSRQELHLSARPPNLHDEVATDNWDAEVDEAHHTLAGGAQGDAEGVDALLELLVPPGDILQEGEDAHLPLWLGVSAH